MDKNDKTKSDVLEKIDLMVLDVDGVLTDGRVILDAEGRETKVFHVLDGAGIKYWRRVGKQVAIISGRESKAVLHRATELGIAIVKQAAKEKLPVYQSILSEMNLPEDKVAVMGDDLTDLPLLRRCGFSIAPANAVEQVRDSVDLITRATGGNGAVREAIEYILKTTGLWKSILRRYNETK